MVTARIAERLREGSSVPPDESRIRGHLTMTAGVGAPGDKRLEPEQEMVPIAWRPTPTEVPVREFLFAIHGATETRCESGVPQEEPSADAPPSARQGLCPVRLVR